MPALNRAGTLLTALPCPTVLPRPASHRTTPCHTAPRATPHHIPPTFVQRKWHLLLPPRHHASLATTMLCQDIPWDQLILHKRIGEGAFGRVRRLVSSCSASCLFFCFFFSPHAKNSVDLQCSI